MNSESVTLEVDGAEPVTGLLIRPPGAMACYVFAPGAGAGMEHSFMTACADELAGLRIATLRYQFPYMQRGSRRPDLPETCHATVRAAVRCANELRPAIPLIAGGRSFGGRMTSQAQALGALPASARPRLSGISVASVKEALRRARQASVRRKGPDASCRGHATSSRRSICAGPGVQAWIASHAASRRGGGSFVPVPARSGRKDAEVRGSSTVFSEWTAAITEGVRST